MNITVVGPGGIGLLFACLLKRGGADVWLLDKEIRKDRTDLINHRGIRIHAKQGFSDIMVRATANPGDLPIPDVAIVAVKAYDTETALRDAQEIIGEETYVLFLQNGIQDTNRLEKWIRAERILLGVTTHASTVLGNGEIIHQASGNTVVGGKNPSSMENELVERLKLLSIEMSHTSNASGSIWGKAIVNSVINPLTAILGVPNGKLAEMSSIRPFITEIVKEGMNVAEALGISLNPPDPLEFTYEVINKTSSNRSSMLQDLEKGSRTEIDYINGAIMKAGHDLGINVTVNTLLTRLIKRLESGGTEIDAKTTLLKEAVVAK
ncbi:MAG: ketopantoate reductase family protein [Nitrososphaerales archaeon]